MGKTGTLYVVATPIGNLADITFRAVEVLKTVDLIAAEDTRHTRGLLNHYGIRTPLASYFGAREKEKAEGFIAKLREGLDVALVSDAGTPGISDPGIVLVRRAVEEGFSIVPIPGPSALAAAISVSGLPVDSFLFAGFLPQKKKARRDELSKLARERKTIVFYEAPHRIGESLRDMAGILGPDRPAVVGREITKLHETFLRGALGEIASRVAGEEKKGEYVVIVGGASPDDDEGNRLAEAFEEMRAFIGSGLSRKEAARRAGEAHGISTKVLYDASLRGGIETGVEKT